MSKTNHLLTIIVKTAAGLILCCAAVVLALGLTFYAVSTSVPKPDSVAAVSGISIMDALDAHVETAMADAEEGARSVRKHFWLDEDALAGPVPNQDCYGQAASPSELQWLLDEAAEVLDGQSTLFNTDIEILEGSVVNYYLDDSIFAVTWKQVFDNFVYTISEVKITDPSQFRRHLVNNEYGSYNYQLTTQMAAETNAVVASSADFYRTRGIGTIVYDREVKKVSDPYLLDICYIDTNGDLIFSYRGELTDEESVQKFVDENDILFSIAFGPVLVDNGERCEPYGYSLGELNDPYPRAALCQRDKLHYLVVAATGEGGYYEFQTLHTFAKNIATFGCQKAYTLDGGQTINIVMNNQLINNVNYGFVKPISDIIYFATAIPNPNQE